MKPRAPGRIDVHIDRIQLRGFSAAHGAALSRDLQAELTRLLLQEDSANALTKSHIAPDTILRGNLRSTTPAGLVRGLASSIVQGLKR